MYFNNTWQQCIPEHNRVSHMYTGVPTPNVNVTDRNYYQCPAMGISVVLTVRLLFVGRDRRTAATSFSSNIAISGSQILPNVEMPIGPYLRRAMT